MAMRRGLESVIWDNYREIESTLARHGYRPNAEINRFALYQLSLPGNLNDGRGTFFAVRESVLKRGTVERAIFWDSKSLEDALTDLSSLPRHNIRKSVKDEVISISGIFMAAYLGITAAFLTRSTGLTLGVVASYFMARTIYSVLRNYNKWESALAGFEGRVEGKDALSRALELTEIARY